MVNCTGIIDGRAHSSERRENGKCESHNPEYVGRLRVPDRDKYCQRKIAHGGVCQSRSHTWVMGAKIATPRVAGKDWRVEALARCADLRESLRQAEGAD